MRGLCHMLFYILLAWPDRFKQYTNRKRNIDIGPLFKEGAITETEWKTKKEKIQQDFLWALGPEATHQ